MRTAQGAFAGCSEPPQAASWPSLPMAASHWIVKCLACYSQLHSQLRVGSGGRLQHIIQGPSSVGPAVPLRLHNPFLSNNKRCFDRLKAPERAARGSANSHSPKGAFSGGVAALKQFGHY